MNLHDYVKALAAWPRGAGTPEEKKAREYITDRLEAMGYRPGVEYFSTPPTFSYTYIAIYILIAGAPLFALVGARAAAALSALAGLALLMLEEELYEPLLTSTMGRLLGRKSANIIASIGRGPRRFVLMAHYDSSKAAYLFDPRRVKMLRPTIILNFLTSLTCFGLIAIHALTGAQQALIAALVASIPLWISIAVLIHRELFHTYVPGANDNASGVAVLLSLAEILREREKLLDRATIYIIFTGAEEVGLLGSYWLFRRHPELAREVHIINLDSLGAGELVLTLCEGVVVEWCTPADFAARLKEYAASRGIKVTSYMMLPTDATIAMRRGWRATSLMALQDGLIANYHWYTDTPDRVNPQNLERSRELVLGLLEVLA